MTDVELTLEREHLDGLVAVGTYLSDAIKRFGIRYEENCVIANGEHYCGVIITKGSENLSLPTAEEIEFFRSHEQADNERLSCQTLIEKAGEVAVMTKDKKEQANEEEQLKGDDYRKTFEALPLEKKIANLVQLEAITLGETVSFIVNSPFMVFEKIGDVMAGFGFKLEKDKKDASRPKEHNEKEAAKTKSVDVDDAETTDTKADTESE